MADNETIVDIIAEMRRRSDEAYKGSFNYPECQENQIEYDEASEWADRLEDARKRETVTGSNQLREALKLCVDEMCDRCRELAVARGNPLPCLSGCEPVRKAKAALAAPTRNCDRFATVDEAREAHDAICDKYDECHHCPLNNEEHYSAFDCFEAWLFAPATEKEGGNYADK